MTVLLAKTEGELEKETYKAEELGLHSEGKESEISRLADQIQRLESSEKSLKAQLEDDTKVTYLENELQILKSNHHAEVDALHNQLEAKS